MDGDESGPPPVDGGTYEPGGLGDTATAAPADLGYSADTRASLERVAASSAAASIAGLGMDHGGREACVVSRTGAGVSQKKVASSGVIAIELQTSSVS